MRITKVAFAFFSVGFLAGSFEQAAGLGQVDREQIERYQLARADAAILRTVGAAFEHRSAFMGGLPEELLARPLSFEPNVPGEVTVALSEMVDEQGQRPRPVVHSPEQANGLDDLGTIDPDLRLHGFGSKRARSEPSREPLSRMPPPLSLRPAVPDGPFGGPGRGPGRGEADDLQMAEGSEFIMPFERGRVTSLFHDRRYHPAIDLAGPMGTPVHATTRQQRVIFAGWRNGYGNTVVTRDGVGRMHLYAHLQRVATKVGVVLDQGKTLGLLGSTGHSTGPHVHYEVKTRVGAHINPATLLFPGRRVGRGLAWNGSRSMTRVASRTDRDQPRPR